MINVNKYNLIGNLIGVKSYVYPKFYTFVVADSDYKNEVAYRYFVQKINDLIITEVDKNIYNKIYVNYFNKLVIQWIISGPKNNQYKNKILDRKGVQEQNIQTLVENEKSMKGIKNYLNNPLEFWFGK
jgi:hypothetical protein